MRQRPPSIALLLAALIALGASTPFGAHAAPLDQLPLTPRGPLTQGPLLTGPPLPGLPVQSPGLQPVPQAPLPLTSPFLRDAPPADPAARSSSAQDPVSQGLAPLRETYSLLLDRHVDTILPGNLISAAQVGLTTTLTDLGVTAPAEPSTFGNAPPATDRQAGWQWLAQRYRALATQYSDKISPRDLAYGAATAMAVSLDDGHTQFLLPKEYEEHRAWARGDVHYGGVGMRLRGPEPTVAQVFPDSPAAKSGVQVGDVIVAVDNNLTLGLRIDEIVDRVRGPEGSAVQLRLRRASTGVEETLSLQRAQVNLPFVESRVDGDLGYIALRGFPEPSVLDQVDRAMQSLQSQGVKGLVFDLRGNSGGRLDVGTRMLGRFIGDGVVYQMVDRQGRGDTQRLRGAQPTLTVPLAVLVDEGTASMGELFAATIQERGVGRVIGSTTAGSVSASVIVPLSDGSALQLTVERLLTGNGRSLDKVGVTPDQPVALPITDIQAGRDTQLDAATAYLRSGTATAPPTVSRATR